METTNEKQPGENALSIVNNTVVPFDTDAQDEIIIYQPNSTIRLDVRIEDETVWLTQAQIAYLFGTQRQAITKHIQNIYDTGELTKEGTSSILELVQMEGSRAVKRIREYYNLDMVLSIGYRVNSKNATAFRIWANKVLKNYLLNKHTINQKIIQIEDRMDRRLLEHDKQIENLSTKVDFFVKTALPPLEGVFFDGQIFDAHQFVCDLVRQAQKRIILIDNYVDETVLSLLDKRKKSVSALIYTQRPSVLTTDLRLHNAQYPSIDVIKAHGIHDRFLIIDETIYHIGASIKDLGKKLFGFSRMKLEPDVILSRINSQNQVKKQCLP